MADDPRNEGEDPFDDEELARAMEDLEQEFRDQSGNEPADGDAPDDGLADELRKDLSEFEHGLTFDEELQGLLGNKASCAMLCTRLQDADLLAAFCTLSDISAECVQDARGAVAILQNLDGNNPERAAEDITTVVSGLSVLLVVNHADKIETTVYLAGKAGEHLPPPFVFPTLAPFVEDLMLGIGTLDDVRASGITVVSTASLDRDGALAIIAGHTRFEGGNGHVG